MEDTELFGQYKLLVTPALYSASDALITALKAYVEQGGHLVSTFKTAFSDPVLKIYADDQPHGLTDVFGMTYDQFTDAVNVSLKDCAFPVSSDSTGAAHYWMELLIPDTAQTLAVYDHPYWKEYAAVTRNRYGRGSAVYLGCYFDTALLKDLLSCLAEDAGLPLPAIHYPIVTKRGVNELQRQITYFFNYADAPASFPWQGGDAVLLMQDEALRHGDTITLGGWDFVIVEEM